MTVLVWMSSWSASVDLPWSMWAMIEKFRMYFGGTCHAQVHAQELTGLSPKAQIKSQIWWCCSFTGRLCRYLLDFFFYREYKLARGRCNCYGCSEASSLMAAFPEA